ncbi:MAG: BMP family ABC transporter substrate-binding protein [Myxococcales bacterium]|nr:BMP family ABC transporter substrate-binding protein [Myxococcales bacterium]
MTSSRSATVSFLAGAACVALALSASACKRVRKADPADPAGKPEAQPAGSGAESPPTAPGTAKIGLVFDVGGLGDKSFNDAANRGLTRAKTELGVTTQYIEPGDGSDRESALRQRAAAGDQLVIGVGFIFSDDITKLAAAFPKTRFAAVDYNLPEGMTAAPANLLGLRFREHEGSFLVGAIAGRVTKSKKIGFVGGMKTPLIRKFEAGFEAGIKHVCPDCTLLSAYAGTEPKAFADPTKGKELALAQYARGADIIYHASGKTGDGVFDAAKEQKKLAIGVDSDQFHVAPCCVLTSMVKQVDVAVFDVIKKVVDGTFTSGVLELGLAERGVGFVYDDNNKAMIPQAVVDEVNGLSKQIVEGAIKVPFE